jgi:GDP/UDP-N,N'-diacetylbacillosamine 2-epimerase (hydrolysing)
MKILVPIGCRSDEGLSAPIIKRMELAGFEIETIELKPQNFLWSYEWVNRRLAMNKYDLIFITGDRVEMCAAAAAAFHNKIPIAHYYAGVINDPVTTFDDIDRHCITLWSDIQFVENYRALEVVWDLKYASGSRINRCYDVGISHLDDLEIDESLVPSRNNYKTITTLDEGDGVIIDGKIPVPYDLVLMNHESKYPKGWFWDKERYEIQIEGNPDGKPEKLIGCDVLFENLPRAQFLGLLKNCTRFITNSSCAIYEAPYFLKPEQIIMIGDRNKNRPKDQFKTGASDRIVKILQEIFK